MDNGLQSEGLQTIIHFYLGVCFLLYAKGVQK